MFIVIVSVAVAGILLVMNVTTKGSADPLIHKQALAIAESLLEEVELMPFTFCDPNDPAAATAANSTFCAAGMDQDKGGAALTSPTPAGETRYLLGNPFDNVADYGGCQMNTGTINACDTTGTNGIRDINNNVIGPAAGYSASIAIARRGLTMAPALLADADALLITVTVTGPDGVPVVIEGIRTRYSPNAVP
ncbi:MAG TPA: type II secretion system protein [Gallionella sp.]|nr:type II secretion system protein [Gallionella sp.]